MKLSVCTATYNVLGTNKGAEALERCIRSVAALTIDHEHLICDGASTDGTLDLLMRLAKEVPTLKVVSEPDRGIYDALNKGLARAEGEYFYVLGADDFICDPKAFASALERAESERADIFISPVRLEDGRTVPSPWREVCEMDVGMAYSHQGAFVRTTLVRELGGYDCNYRFAADYKLHLAAHWRGARTGLSQRIFAQYGLAGASTVVSAQAVRDECSRARCEVFGLSNKEAARHLQSRFLPVRVIINFCRARDAFSRRIGRSCLRHWVYRKQKDESFSRRFLLGLPIWSHRRKTP